MKIKDNISKAEQEFPRLFSCYEECSYGTLFYNTKIKDHHDSNHAILYTSEIKDLNAVLVDIRDFYQSKEIVPTIYHPITENYFIENAKTLKSNGYEFMTSPDSRIMLLKNTNSKPMTNLLNIKRITDINMINDGSFFIEHDQYLTEIYRNCINKSNHYLFVGYYENKPVTLLSFHISNTVVHGLMK